MFRSLSSRRLMPVLLSACACLAFTAAGPRTARGDALDVALMERIETVRDYLLDQHYESVGVLSFRIKRGDALPTFDGGTIVNSMADRLETALIACLQQDRPLRVAHHASAAAGKALGAANYRTEDERRRLFEVEYPQAWGNPPPLLRVDAFLTGKLVVSDDQRTVAIVVEVFDRREPGYVRDVVQFETTVDRQLLTELGQGFSVSELDPKANLRAVTEDDVFAAIEAAKKKPLVVEPISASTVLPQPVKVTVYYDDVEQELSADSSRAGNANFTLVTPREGQLLSIGVANQTNEKLGLVVTVNGVNTLYEQKGSPAVLKKWVLEPGVEYRIKGFYSDGDTYKTIRALSERESAERFADLGGPDSAGVIQVHVFRPTPPAQITSITTSPSIRLLSDAELAEYKPGTLAELQSLIVPGKFNRGLFTWGDKRAEAVATSRLGPAQMTDSLVIRYYTPPAQ